ncbi:MAG: hypothetical protein IH899_01080 [Planctomycetes bacterium]|nr:hypothetical protein [Planctomycetota bacterium]
MECRSAVAVFAIRRPAEPDLRCYNSSSLQVRTGDRFHRSSDFFRSSTDDDLAAEFTRFRTEIDDVIGSFDDLQVVLDDD